MVRNRWLSGFSVGVLLVCQATTANAQPFSEVAELLASDGAEDDDFGVSICIAGNRAIVGASWDDDNGLQSGSAYVFERDFAGNWTEVQKLLASDGTTGDFFGASVFISGDRAIVGAHIDDDNGDFSGAAYVFERDGGGGWTEVRKLLASDGEAGDFFGHSVCISGDWAIVGAPGDDDGGDSSGSAYVFAWDGGLWTELQKLLPGDGAADDAFGAAVSLSGDVAIVGAQGDANGGPSPGSAYVFEREGGIWTEVQKLLAGDGAASDLFGWSVGISGDRAIVGAIGDDDNGGGSGSAYVFERNGVGIWTEVQKLLASDGAFDDTFGHSVSLSGGRAIVGAFRYGNNGSQAGTAYVFERDGGGNWTEVQKLFASDEAAGDGFGRSVSISGDQAIVGAFRHDDNGIDSGAAYVFETGPIFKSRITDGPDVDGDLVIDRVVKVGPAAPATYTFEITINQPELPRAMVLDVVPAEWQVVSAASANTADLVLVSPAGKSGKSATRIQWLPTDNNGSLEVTVRTRPRGQGKKFAPTTCGVLVVDNGARVLDPATRAPLLDEDGNPLTTDPLCLVALQDLNRDGIDYSGHGDEDRDGVPDLLEVFLLLTDPCAADTDGDGAPDGTDPAPRDRRAR